MRTLHQACGTVQLDKQVALCAFLCNTKGIQRVKARSIDLSEVKQLNVGELASY